ncbi:MAG: DUF4416 family protein [Candidatus Eisenbacteria sp.]|nr:DUF4416 family protein [Candidatus Eisenbacteria bacterium]
MAIPESPTQAKLLIAVMTPDPRCFDLALAELESTHGAIDATSPEIRDPHYRHYEDEMGPALTKRILAFEKLVDPEQLVSAKTHTNAIELAFSIRGRRTVNLDPGHLTSGNLVLASAKSRSRRIYLRDGIYAELELVYQSGEFRPMPWTYPDFRRPEVLSFLSEVRQTYLAQLTSRRPQ